MFARVVHQVGPAIALLHVLNASSERSQMKVLVTVAVILHLYTTSVGLYSLY